MASTSNGAITLQVPAAAKAVEVTQVKKGETWRFAASGRWRDLFITCGPRGYHNFAADALEIYPRVEEAAWFCLVGKVGGETIVIGQGTTHTFETDGALVVFANDLECLYGNNVGEITLTAWWVSGDVPNLPEPDWSEPQGLAGAWGLFRRTLDKTTGALFVAVLVIGVCLILSMMQQGRDLVRTVGEDRFDLGKPSGWRQFGFGLTLLVMGIQAWLWPRMIINSAYGSSRDRWRPKWPLEWGPRLLGFAPFVLVAVALLANPAPYTAFPITLALVGAAFFIFLIGRKDIARKLPSGARRPHLGRYWVAGGLIVAVVAMIVAIFFPVGAARALGAPSVVFLGVSLLIPPSVILIRLGANFRFPVVGASILAAAIFSLWIDGHEVGRRVSAKAVSGPGVQVSLKQAYEAWRRVAPMDADGTYVMTLVASEGGAARAGFWTGEVLSALHRDGGERFDHSLFAISSVSGGSVGAVGYVAALKEASPRATAEQIEARVSGFAGDDALSPALGGLLFPDLLQRFLPVAVLPDRAEALERAWEVSWADPCRNSPPETCSKDLISGPFLGLWSDFDQAWSRPLVIINGASEETGRPILTSKVAFQPIEMDADNFYGITQSEVAASTAIHNGARFPWISPAGGLIHLNRLHEHIVDGGYFDAAGVETVRELAHAILAGPATNRDKGPDAAPDNVRFVVVFIGYSGATEDAQAPDAVTKTCPHPHRLLNEVLAPFLGMSESRAGHGAHLTRAIKTEFSPMDPNPLQPSSAPKEGEGGVPAASPRAPALKGIYVPILLCDGYDGFEVPMDWALSQKARDFMRRAMGFGGHAPCPGNDQAIKLVVESVQSAVPAKPAPVSVAPR